jgi:hypothetical protein
MKIIYFTIFFIGYLLLLISIYLTNINLLALSELLVFGSAILLIRLKYYSKKSVSF